MKWDIFAQAADAAHNGINHLTRTITPLVKNVNAIFSSATTQISPSSDEDLFRTSFQAVRQQPQQPQQLQRQPTPPNTPTRTSPTTRYTDTPTHQRPISRSNSRSNLRLNLRGP